MKERKMTAQAMELQLLEAEVMINEVKDVLYVQRRKLSYGEEIRSDDPHKLGHLLSNLQNYLLRKNE